MHITLYLRPDTQRVIRLPRSNLHMFQALLYNIMPRDTASFLHDGGYDSGSKKMKLFAMSWPHSDARPEFTPDSIVFTPPMRLTISTPVKETLDALVYGAVSAERLRVGSNFMTCSHVEVRQYRAEGNSIMVKTLSPVTCYRNISDGTSQFVAYFSPDMQEFEDFVDNNLRSKFRALRHDAETPSEPVRITPVGDMYERAALHTRNSKVPIKGWSGRFLLEGPQELLQTALDCGIGTKNSGGWGCVIRDDEP